MTHEQREKAQQEFQDLSCKQKKYRELTSHLESNGQLKENVNIDKEQKYDEKFDKLDQ